MKNKYQILGIWLLLGGAILVSSYFLLGSTLIAALGISAVIVGCSCIVLREETLPQFVLSLATMNVVLDTLAKVFGQSNIEVFFVLNVISYLVVSLLFADVSSGVRAGINKLGFVMFACFMLLESYKILQILLAA